MSKRTPKIVVSDHAVLRCLERYMGLDVEKFRVLLAGMAEPAVRIKAKNIVYDDLELKIEGNTVTTCLKVGQ